MILSKKQLMLAFSLLAVSLQSFSAAENYSFLCTFDKAERKIEVIYLQQGSAAPCEVHYTKGSTSKKLWSAIKEEGFCESKAQAFRQKQEGWGWSCTAGSQSIASSASDQGAEADGSSDSSAEQADAASANSGAAETDSADSKGGDVNSATSDVAKEGLGTPETE